MKIDQDILAQELASIPGRLVGPFPNGWSPEANKGMFPVAKKSPVVLKKELHVWLQRVEDEINESIETRYAFRREPYPGPIKFPWNC